MELAAPRLRWVSPLRLAVLSVIAMGAPAICSKTVGPVPLWVIIAAATTAGVLVIVLGIALGLPQNYTCLPARKSYYRALVPNPGPVVSFTPTPIVCTADAATRDSIVTLTGSNMLFWEKLPPSVEFDHGAKVSNASKVSQVAGACHSIKVRGRNAVECSAITFAAPAYSSLDTFYAPEVEIAFAKNVDCARAIAPAGSFYFAPPPVLMDVSPPVICSGGAAGRHELVVSGNFLLWIGDSVPVVTINGVHDPLFDNADPAKQMINCTQLPVLGISYNISYCTQMRISVDPSATYLNQGQNTVHLSNPAGAGCGSAASVNFLLLPRPTFSGLSQTRICSVPGHANYGLVTATGSSILMVDGVSSNIDFNGVPSVAPAASGCVNVNLTNSPHTVRQCTSFTFSTPNLDAQQRAIGSVYTPVVTLIPPSPIMDVSLDAARFGCAVPNSALAAVYPAPVADSAAPNPQCTTTPGTVNTMLTSGPGILNSPLLAINNIAYPGYVTSNCSTMTDLFGDSITVCHALNISTTPTANPIGPAAVNFTNSAAFDMACAPTVSSNSLLFAPPPTAVSTAPNYFCSGSGGTLSITGTGFTALTSVWMQRNCTGVTGPCNSGTVYNAPIITYVNSTLIVATWYANAVPGGQYLLGLANGGNCVFLGLNVNVRALVLVFYADPPTAYNGIEQSISAYTTGLSHDTASVVLFSTTSSYSLNLSFSETSDVNRLSAILPSGIPTGSYGIRVTTTYGCSGDLGGALNVVSAQTMLITQVDPQYLYNGTASSVDITSSPLQDGFEPIPYTFLSPVGGGIAIPLRSVFLTDSHTMTATVEAGLPAGSYFLVIVNLNGSVGITDVFIVAQPLPIITQVAPSYFTTTSGQVASITGANFNTAGVFLNVTCLTSTGTMVMNEPVISNLLPNSFTAVFDFSGTSNGAACNIRVNNIDGPNTLFVAVSTKISSGNLAGFSIVPGSMLHARQGHALLLGQVTPSLHFLYAIGGNNGTNAGAMSSVEKTQIDRFGSSQSWIEHPTDALPVQTGFLAGASIGRFLYVAGGTNTTGYSTTAVYRAQVLDPADVVTVDLQAELNPASQLLEGLYFYRVCAEYPLSDIINPGGWSLPSDIISVRVPNITTPLFPAALDISLSWTADARASAYHVFRSGPGPNAPMSSISLIATLPSTITLFTDNGTYANTLPTTPRVLGDLGAWNYISDLQVPRSSFAMSSAVVPGSSGSAWFLHAWLGATNTPTTTTYPKSYEQNTVNVLDPNNPFTGAFSTFVHPTAARSGVGISHITSLDNPAVTPADTDYFFLAAGQTGIGTYADVVDLINITSTGPAVSVALCGSSGTPCSTGHVTGYCAIQAAGIDYWIAGASTTAPTQVAAQSAPVLTWPKLANPTPNGAATIPVALVNVACLATSAHMFITGGMDATGNVYNSTIVSTQ